MSLRCWAESYCAKRIQKVECHELCDAYVLLRAIYAESNLPKIYQYEHRLRPEAQDLDAFVLLNDYKDNIVAHVVDGKGLYLWSNTTGNGKTSWASKIVNYYIRKTIFTSGLENEVVYINVPTFLEQLRESYNTKDMDFERLKDKVIASKLLLADDIGSEKPTEWVKERLYTIINHRVTQGLTTIYTSNVSPIDLRSKLGDRIFSRVLGSSTIVELKGADRRLSV